MMLVFCIFIEKTINKNGEKLQIYVNPKRLYDTMKEFLKRHDKTQKLLTVLLFNNNVLSILILIISKKKCKICYKF